MIKMISLKCPECRADLSIEDGCKECFCQYCGAKIIVTNENEHIYRHIDEAKLKEAETDQVVKLRKLDFIERKRAEAEKIKWIKIIASIIMGIVGVIIVIAGFCIDGMGMLSAFGMLFLMGIMLIWLSNSKDKDDDDVDDGVELEDKRNLPSAVCNDEYKSKNYSTIEALFTGAGFTNIRCIPLNDLAKGFSKKSGKVEEITINGQEISSDKKKYSPDASVVITYHSPATFEDEVTIPFKFKTKSPAKIKVPSAISGYGEKQYTLIETLFVDAGFTNVKCIPVNDLMVGLFSRPGTVKDITVDGKSILFGGKKCSPDVPVVITYHALVENRNGMSDQQR